jgi:hypothetical protein
VVKVVGVLASVDDDTAAGSRALKACILPLNRMLRYEVCRIMIPNAWF